MEFIRYDMDFSEEQFWRKVECPKRLGSDT